MAVVYTLDVFCDAEDCGQWINGITSTNRPASKDTARRCAANETDGDRWRFGPGKDFCPQHALAQERT